ncbi:hypothetical protein MMC06_001158, partial [Schaereria dolodes]|nr:hypothetical protein [Schaereria dolodes]
TNQLSGQEEAMPQAASWTGTPRIKGSTESIRMALLTASLVGLQFTWGIEMTYCTPYLLSLGLTKSRLSLVWVAGPLSGLIMQPVVGISADRSRSKWGRRRPFMIGGSMIVAVCLLILGWTSELIGHFTLEAETRRLWTIALAVSSIYVLDFAINAVQSSCRSLIVDTLPIAKQQLGSAWASRMVAVGHLVGYGAGTIDLLMVFGPSLGDSQFKQLTVIAAAALLFSVGITSYAVEERVLISTSTTWVGEIWMRYSGPLAAQNSTDTLGDIGRIGSLSLVVFSVITFAGSILLPWVVKSPEDEKPGFTPRPPPSIALLVRFVNQYKPDLLTAWMLGHLIFAGAMSLAPFVSSVRFATLLVSICGIPWALACWAPFAFMGIEINRLTSPTHILANGSAATTYRPLPYTSASPRSSFELAPQSPTLLRLNHLDRDLNDDDDAPSSQTGETAGIYLGILNLFTTLPQFVGTAISMVVFSMLEPGTSPELAEDGVSGSTKVARDGPNAISVCLFIGAISAVGAAWATRRLGEVR